MLSVSNSSQQTGRRRIRLVVELVKLLHSTDEEELVATPQKAVIAKRRGRLKTNRHPPFFLVDKVKMLKPGGDLRIASTFKDVALVDVDVTQDDLYLLLVELADVIPSADFDLIALTLVDVEFVRLPSDEYTCRTLDWMRPS